MSLYMSICHTLLSISTDYGAYCFVIVGKMYSTHSLSSDYRQCVASYELSMLLRISGSYFTCLWLLTLTPDLLLFFGGWYYQR